MFIRKVGNISLNMYQSISQKQQILVFKSIETIFLTLCKVSTP